MEDLVAGIARFQRESYPSHQQRFAELAHGQAPRILVITCSDSRVVPSLITDSQPGELFVLRNAGNLVPAYGASRGGEEATIEYAVAVLGVRHIVVCGHSDCGAMKGLLRPQSVAALPAVRRWLELAQATLAVTDSAVADSAGDDQRLERTIELNTLRQLDNLRTHPSVAAALTRRELDLHAWVYDIGSGNVATYDSERQSFVPLRDELQPVGRYLTLAAG